VQENIGDDELLSRHVFEPRMYLENQLIWKALFEFPDGQGESLLWHRHVGYAPVIPEIHECGCRREVELRQRDQARGRPPRQRYVGTITATAFAIRAYQNSNGHGFALSHEPSEGREHVQVLYRSRANANAMTRADKNELKLKLLEIFSSLAGHSCEAVS
jgi:hypothetical protein